MWLIDWLIEKQHEAYNNTCVHIALVMSLESSKRLRLDCDCACHLNLLSSCFARRLLEERIGKHDNYIRWVCRARQNPCLLARGKWVLVGGKQVSLATCPPGQYKVEPEPLEMYTFHDFTLRYFELIRRWLPFGVHSKGETAHRRKKSGQVRINSGQVELSRSLPQGQAEN